MSTILTEPARISGLKSGTVVVTREISASAEKIWKSLTEPSIVSQWLGTLTAPLVDGQKTRLDFGDGDFFVLQDVALKRPTHLRYSWRFLGIGPLDTINWQISPRGALCKVTVTDSEPERTPEAGAQLREGWLDFTKRLKDYFIKGRPTRYIWRHDLDASVEVFGSVNMVWDTLFGRDMQPEWLPLDEAVLDDGCRFSTDGGKPSEFRVSDVVWNPPVSVSFQLKHPVWLRPTACELKLYPRSRDVILSASQYGWVRISKDKEYQRQQRATFCSVWIEALKRARALTS